MTDEWIEKTGGGENALERSIGSLKTLILTKALYVDGENVMCLDGEAREERAKELINTDILNFNPNKNINNINIEDVKILVSSNKNNIEKESFKENIKELTKPIYKPIAYSNQNSEELSTLLSNYKKPKEVKKIPQAKTKNNPNKSNFLNFNFGNFSSFSDDFN